MSTENKKGVCRSQIPTRVIVERHYVGTEKMETVFKKIAEEQIAKKVNEMTQNCTN
jgi:hypothetical protein